MGQNLQIDYSHMTNYSNQQIMERVNIGLQLLFEKDSFLLENTVHENSISHKLAEYLQNLFPKYNVDFSYNKDIDEDGFDSKRESGIQTNDHTNRAIPDIIIHNRGTNNHLVIIEIKPYADVDPFDRTKLEKFTSCSGKHKYQLGLYIGFNLTQEPTQIWFHNGREINNH